jgi:hypothetical protein
MKLLLNLSIFAGLSGCFLMSAAPSSLLKSQTQTARAIVAQSPLPDPHSPDAPALAQSPLPDPHSPDAPALVAQSPLPDPHSPDAPALAQSPLPDPHSPDAPAFTLISGFNV